jgi:hypothetical protein
VAINTVARSASRVEKAVLVIRSVSSHARHNAIALLALFVALGGTSYAAIKLPANSVGTVQIKKGAVTSVKIKDGSIRAADLAAGTLKAGGVGPAGPKGDAGPPGPKGDIGPAGASATALWAVVRGNGTLARASHVALTEQNNPGVYQVVFDRNITDCAFIAGRGAADSSSAADPGEISATRLPGGTTNVLVVTYNSAGTPADADFHLAVFC